MDIRNRVETDGEGKSEERVALRKEWIACEMEKK